jgi:putative ATPase
MLEPLSSALRPRSLDDFVGQEHLVGLGSPIRKFIERGHVPSMVFWGPPGTGKTTVAFLISQNIRAEFFHLSGVISKKEDITKIISKAKTNFNGGIPTIVFLDEIHRWNKAQQDVLLPFVEKGIVILIGATTENPSFTVNNALLSRARVYTFRQIEPEEVLRFFTSRLDEILARFPGVTIGEGELRLLAEIGNGDLRNSLNLLETTLTLAEGAVSREDVLRSVERSLYYDRDSEEHYNIISAVHKCLRDSDPDAACYWIGRMLAGGEDPLYVVRRLLRFASEDIGLRDTHALMLANTVYEAVEKVGMPECELFIYELAVYLGRAPKDNSIYRLSHMVRDDIKKYGNVQVPMNIRNAPTKLMKGLGYGAGYKYAHDYKDETGEVEKIDQEHFPPELAGRRYLED